MGIINNIFGEILNLIFEGVALILPIGTLGVAIIIFTLVARLLLTPLQIKQQRTTRAMGRIQPELQKLQKKYANKKDQASQMAYSQEMQAIYKKYNISPFAGCLPLLIQLPLIYALFNVLRQPSMYIDKMGELYGNIAQIIMNNVANYQSLLSGPLATVSNNGYYAYDMTSIVAQGDVKGLADFLSQMNTQHWTTFLSQIPADIQGSLTQLLEQKHNFEYFLVNLVDSPQQLIASGVVLAWLVPIIAGASTFIFSKITMASSQASQPKSDSPSQTETMMKTMNIMMPIMTGMFSYTVPCGVALYWIAGNIIMMGQQLWVNKIVDKEDKKLAEELRKQRELEAANKPKKKKRKKPVLDADGNPIPKADKPKSQSSNTEANAHKESGEKQPVNKEPKSSEKKDQ